MRILFATSLHPAKMAGGTAGVLRNYLRELRKRADVLCVVFDWDCEQLQIADEDADCILKPQAALDVFSQESRFIEAAASLRTSISPLIAEFRPEVIQCADSPAFLPFRFDKNVLYAAGITEVQIASPSHVQSRSESRSLRTALFRDVRIERCAIANCAVLTVPSEFAAENAERIAGGMCCPIVLPPGLPEMRQAETKAGRQAEGEVPRTVAFFGRLDDARSGINDFICAVNQLGEHFKRKNNVRYELHGAGHTEFVTASPLIDAAADGSSPEEAIRSADIAVIPSRDAPFGIAALEAMAQGALVLLPQGLGMDSFAVPEINCIPISRNYFEIADAIQDAVENFGRYKFMRDNARRTASEWGMVRCVCAYLAIFREICRRRVPQLCSAHRKESRRIIERYRKASDVEKIYCAEQERRAAHEAVRMLLPQDCQSYGWRIQGDQSDRKTLVLTGVYTTETDDGAGAFSEQITVVPTLDERADGTIVRPECLPFRDGEFDDVIAVGALESSVEPCGAGDWKQLSGSGWNCTVCHEEVSEDDAPKITAFPFMSSFSAACYSKISADENSAGKDSDRLASEIGENAANFGKKISGNANTELPEAENLEARESDCPPKSVPQRISSLVHTKNPFPYQIVVYSRRAHAPKAGTNGGTA